MLAWAKAESEELHKHATEEMEAGGRGNELLGFATHSVPLCVFPPPMPTVG